MSDYDHKPAYSLDEIGHWLAEHHGASIEGLHSIRGGYWSSAFGYTVDGEGLVLRLGESDEGYRIDRAAHRFAGHGVPVPEVIDIGRAFDRHFAISRRLEGSFLEEAEPRLAPALGPAVAAMLRRLRSVPANPGEGVEWYAPAGGGAGSWRGWLRIGLDQHADAWADRTRDDHHLAALWRRCIDGIEALLPACPERRDLVHGDLLHQNVLISPDGTEVTGVFSWKCSARGDFLYDALERMVPGHRRVGPLGANAGRRGPGAREPGGRRGPTPLLRAPDRGLTSPLVRRVGGRREPGPARRCPDRSPRPRSARAMTIRLWVAGRAGYPHPRE